MAKCTVRICHTIIVMSCPTVDFMPVENSCTTQPQFFTWNLFSQCGISQRT